MDPLSITATVVGLTAKCMQTAKSLNDLRNTYQYGQTTISAICAETTTISTSLSHLQALMLQNQEIVSSRFLGKHEIQGAFDTILTGCMLVYAALDDEVLQMKGAGDGFRRLGFRAKTKYVWNESMMQSLLAQLRGQQSAMTLLLQLLQM